MIFDDDIDRLQEKKVRVYRNGDFQNGRDLYVAHHWEMDDLLNAASQRLNLMPTAKRIFLAGGKELDDVIMLEDDEVLFISAGPDFIPPTATTPNTKNSHIEECCLLDERSKVQSHHLPSSLGGYYVGNLLGEGGFGEVRVGTHQTSGEQTALKFLPKSSIVNMDDAERMTTEIECLTALRHPNIIKLLQQVDTPDHLVLVFELMAGDLYNYLCDLPEQRLKEEQAQQVFHQVLSGVGHAHNHHICHRDLKLDNILLSEHHGLAHVKVADFGLSDFYRPGAMMRSSCGSLSYLAPEVFKGTSNAGPPLDIWSLGVILFGTLFGRLPFEGPSLRGSSRPREADIRSRISKCQFKMDELMAPDAKDLIRRMLKLDPEERASLPEVFNHCWFRQRELPTPYAQSISSIPIPTCHEIGGWDRPVVPGPPAAISPENRMARAVSLNAPLEDMLETSSGPQLRLSRSLSLTADDLTAFGLHSNERTHFGDTPQKGSADYTSSVRLPRNGMRRFTQIDRAADNAFSPVHNRSLLSPNEERTFGRNFGHAETFNDELFVSHSPKPRLRVHHGSENSDKTPIASILSKFLLGSRSPGR